MGSFIYRVDKAGIEPSFLFGTIHHLDDQIHLGIMEKSLMDACDLVVLENSFDPAMLYDDFSKLLQSAFLDFGNGLNLKAMLGDDDLYRHVVVCMSKKLGFPEFVTCLFKPWACAMMLAENFYVSGAISAAVGQWFLSAPQMNVLLDKLKGFFQSGKMGAMLQTGTVDALIYNAAKNLGKDMRFLGSMGDMVRIFEHLSPQEVSELLRGIEVEAPPISSQTKAKIVDSYKANDLSGFRQWCDLIYSSYEAQGGIAARLMQAICDDRTVQWMGTIEELLNRGKCFFAMGAAHLIGLQGERRGRFGLLNMLSERGYRLTPM